MPEAIVQQEFYCSFDTPVEGSYYGDKILYLESENRLRSDILWEPARPVNTAWDIGIGDSTAIHFHQQVGGELRLIDYYEGSGHGIEHYAKLLQEKPYVYGDHLAPHDIEAREYGTGRSRLEIARQFGLRFRVVPKLSIEDGIQAVRAMLPKFFINDSKCERVVQALREYKKQWDPIGQVYLNKPHRDWTTPPMRCAPRARRRSSP